MGLAAATPAESDPLRSRRNAKYLGQVAQAVLVQAQSLNRARTGIVGQAPGSGKLVGGMLELALMDTFEIRMTPVPDEDEVFWSADILVNGRPFLEQVRDFEQPFADAEGHPNIAGSYTPVLFWRDFFNAFADDLQGKGGYPSESGGLWIALFECVCLSPGCWPLMVDLMVEPEHVIWQQFMQPHRRGQSSYQPLWDYSGFGPFTFDRAVFEAEIGKLRTLASQIPVLPDMEDVHGDPIE